PQFVIATDMVKPPGVTMRRKGAAAVISCSAPKTSSSQRDAKPRSRTGASVGSAGSRSKRSSVRPCRSFRIVEDHAERMPPPSAAPAHAMPHVYPIAAAPALHGPRMHGEDHGVSLPQRHHLRPRLHAGPLLSQHELAAREISARLGQPDRDLQREGQLTVEIL